jgi:hypothetical protein
LTALTGLGCNARANQASALLAAGVRRFGAKLFTMIAAGEN